MGAWRLAVFLGILLAGCASYTLDEKEEPIMGERKAPIPGQKLPKDGWQTTGTLITQNPGQRVSMQADFPESAVYTVQFSIDVVPAKIPNGLGVLVQPDYEVEAVIDWKVEGGNVRRRINVGNGTEISAPSQAVNVAMYDNTPSTGFGPNQKYQVSAQVAPGNRAGVSRCQLKGVTGSLTAAGGASPNILIPVPTDAGVTSVEITGINALVIPPPTPLILVYQLPPSGTGSPLKSYLNPSASVEFVSLHPSCTFIELFNQDAVNGVGYSVTWGIDG